MLKRDSKLVARLVALAACLVVGLLVGGTIVATVASHRSATAQGRCESDVCVWGAFCSDTPGSDTGCDRKGSGCESYICAPN